MQESHIFRSDETDEVFSAFAKFQANMPQVAKNAEVDTGKYSFEYTTLDQLIETAKPVLAEEGLAVTQMLNGGGLTTILTHESGQFIGSTTPIGFSPDSPQKLGSLLTYLKRYAYASILGISSEEDDDANTAAGQDFSKRERTQNSNSDVPWDTGGPWDEPATGKQVDKLGQIYGSYFHEVLEEEFGLEVASEMTKGQASYLFEDEVRQRIKKKRKAERPSPDQREEAPEEEEPVPF